MPNNRNAPVEHDEADGNCILLNCAVNHRRTCIDVMRGFLVWNAFLTTLLLGPLLMLSNSPLVHMLAIQFKHVKWNGYNYYDCIFPGFMILIGASMMHSYERYCQSSDTKKSYFLRKILLRAFLLWVFASLIQLAMFSMPFYNISFFEVFHMLAACILATGVMLITIPRRWYVFALVLFLLAQTLFLTIILVPGHGYGDFSKEGNVEWYFRSVIAAHCSDLFGLRGEYYRWAKQMGSSVMLIKIWGTCLIGLILGRILLSEVSLQKQVVIVGGIGIMAMAVALMLNSWIPINKYLWTPTFTIFSSGVIFIFQAVFIQISEVWKWQKFNYLFTVFGRNSFLAWVFFYYLMPFGDISKQVFGESFYPISGTYYALVLAITPAILCWLLFACLQKRRIITC